MTRIQTACYALMASAFVLAAILFVQIDQRLQPAHAEMVMGQPGLIAMTAQTLPNREALFLLDAGSQQLLVYEPDPGEDRIRRVATLDLAREFGYEVDDDDDDDDFNFRDRPRR